MPKIETITYICDRCGKTKNVIDGKHAFDPNNVFHINVQNPTNGKECVVLCNDCFKRLKDLWVRFMVDNDKEATTNA